MTMHKIEFDQTKILDRIDWYWNSIITEAINIRTTDVLLNWDSVFQLLAAIKHQNSRPDNQDAPQEMRKQTNQYLEQLPGEGSTQVGIRTSAMVLAPQSDDNDRASC